MATTKTLKLPGGGTVLLSGSLEEITEQERVIFARHQFSVDYCRARGWPEDVASLKLGQILEIRKQEGWKNP